MISDVLVVAEHRDGAIRDVTFETIAAATALSGDAVDVALIASDPAELVDDLELDAVGTIHAVTYDAPFNHDVYVQVGTQLADQLGSDLLLAGNTVNGLDYVPALASSLGWPLVTDVVAIEQQDELLLTRERYGSKMESTVAVADPPAVVSLRPGEWDPATAAGSPVIEEPDIDIDDGVLTSQVTGFEAVAEGDVDIADADVLVSVGRGIDEEDNLELIEALADAMGATISASRPIVDAGWLPKGRQVGQSGKTVTPDVYLAIGISGAVQHVAGMSGADTIVAINNDPNAPIFDIADIGIVDDLFDVVPALIEALES